MNMLTGEQIKAIRDSLDLTPTEFGAKVGVSDNTVRRWELGDRHPRWETMEKLNDLAESAIAAGKLPKDFLNHAAAR